MFGGDLGQAYLGTQGDIWDAHKDMLSAAIGALVWYFGSRVRASRDAVEV